MNKTAGIVYYFEDFVNEDRAKAAKSEMLNGGFYFCRVPNIIPDYEKAFFRDFKKFVGETVDAEKDETEIEIKILGQGCSRCNQLEQEVINIVSEMEIDANIEHVTDVKEIGNYGVMGVPALVINGSVKAVGNIPPKHKIMGWLTMAWDDKQKQI